MAELLESVYYDSDVYEKAKEAAFNLYVIEAVLERMLKSAVHRMPERLSFETTYSHIKVLSYYIRSFIAEDMVADPNVMLQSMPLTKLDSDVQEKAMQEKANEAAQVKEMRRIRDIEAMKLEETNAMRNACAQAKAQAKEMKEMQRIRDIEAMKLEEANARWNKQAQAKAQVKEMKAKRIRDIEAKMLRQRDSTGEGEEDQNGKAKKARIDEA